MPPHPYPQQWQQEQKRLAALAQELLRHGAIADADVLQMALTTVHCQGQEFALRNMREQFFALPARTDRRK